MDRCDDREKDAVRVQLFQSHDDDDDTEDNSNCQSHTVSNDAAVTDYENDDDEDTTVSQHSPSDSHLTDFASVIMAVNSNNRDGTLVDGGNRESVLGQNPPVDNFRHGSRAAELVLMDDNVTERGPVTDGHKSSMPSQRLRVSPSDHDENFDDDRDPNYAMQRPDTMGAINVTASVTAAAGVVSGFPVPAAAAARPVHYQLAAAVRAWPVESEDADSGGMLHLGRRTRGAGMDQLELLNHQRHHLIDDGDDLDGEDGAYDDGGGDGSEFCDEEDDNDDDDDLDEDETGLGGGNQCESTEADQYKMDPEADQSGAVDAAQNFFAAAAVENMANNVPLIAGDSMRSVAGFGPTTGYHRYQTDGATPASGAVLASRDSMEEPEEDQADSRHSGGLSNGQDVAIVEPPTSRHKQSLDSSQSHPVPVGSDKTSKHGAAAALKQHPQSAFSIPKPRISSKSKPGSTLSHSNIPVPSVRQSKSNTDIIFKPIGTSSVAKSMNLSVPRTQTTLKASDSLSGAAGTMQGESVHQCSADKSAQLTVLANSGTILSQDRKDALGGGNAESDPARHASKPMHHDVNSAAGGRSLWSRETLWNSMEPQQPGLVWNDTGPSSICVSLPCHLPGDGAAVAPPSANTSSSQQLTPPKAVAHTAFHVLSSSVDISPIQPLSSSASSRPLSVNGLYAVDPALAGGGLAGAGESYMGTPFHYSQKIQYDGAVQPEIKDMETVRGQLHKLLAMSECNIPGMIYFFCYFCVLSFGTFYSIYYLCRCIHKVSIESLWFVPSLLYIVLICRLQNA